MEHLMNCHGEWALVLGALPLIPFVGVWLRAKFGHHHEPPKGK